MREWLLNARKESGKTQVEVARELDITEAYYSFIENGQRQKKMEITLATKLSAIFGIPLQKIAEFEKSEGRM